MQRSRLSSVLAGLGLAAACGGSNTGAPTVGPRSGPRPGAELGPGPGTDVEPSGLGATAKPTTATNPGPHEPGFVGLPEQFCAATLTARDDALLRTSSFLAVWNELAGTIRNPLAPNIPSTEADARIAICGAEQCTITGSRVVEVTADYMVSIGLVIPVADALLVIPSVTAPRASNPCASITAAEFEDHGRLVHVRVSDQQRRYNYDHGMHGYGGRGYGEAYDPVGIQCVDYETSWHDLVIDTRTGAIELVVDHPASVEAPGLGLEFQPAGATEVPQLVLRGCNATLALQWTDPG